MKINYDKISDAIYMYINKGKIKKTIKMDNKLNVDLDKDGKIVGIEMLEVSNNQNAKILNENLKNGIPVEINQSLARA